MERLFRYTIGKLEYKVEKLQDRVEKVKDDMAQCKLDRLNVDNLQVNAQLTVPIFNYRF